MRTVKTLIRLGGRPGWSESSLGAHAISLVLSANSIVDVSIMMLWKLSRLISLKSLAGQLLNGTMMSIATYFELAFIKFYIGTMLSSAIYLRFQMHRCFKNGFENESSSLLHHSIYLWFICFTWWSMHWWVRKPSRGPNNCMFWAMIEAEGEVGLSPPVIFYWPFQGGTSVVVHIYLLSYL